MNCRKNHKVNGCQSQESQCVVWYELQRNLSISWMEDEDVIEIGKIKLQLHYQSLRIICINDQIIFFTSKKSVSCGHPQSSPRAIAGKGIYTYEFYSFS